MKNIVLIFSFLVLYQLTEAQPVSQGFFLDAWVPRQAVIPQSVVAEKPVGAAGVIINVDALDTVAKVSPYIFGNNANTYSTIMHNNPTLVNHIKDMDPHVLRYPGGNLSNVFFWNLEKGQQPADMPQSVIDSHQLWAGMNPDSWTMSVDNYYRFLDSVNCEGIITVNYGYARYGTSDDPVAKAAHLAADWVRYDNGRTKYWEVGNENFGNWQSGYIIDTSLNKDGQPETINGQIYGRHCRVFIDSMKAAAAEIGHTIYIGVQAWESETSWDPVQTDWNELMMPEIADLADFYIVHNYYTPYDEDSDARTILNTYEKSEEFKQSVFNDLAEAGYGPAPLTMTEWNIFAVGSKQQVSHINGIHSVLVTGKMIEDEYGLANRWDLANGWSNGDDHGTFSRGGEPGVEEFEPRPVFYYLTFMQRYFGDVMLKTTGSDEDVIAFASEFEDGPLGVVVVNKGAEAQNVSINTDNFIAGANYYWVTLEGGDLEGEFSRQVVINGHEPNRVAGGPSDYNDIEAYAASIEGGIGLETNPYSVHFILIEGQSEATPVKHSVAIHVFGKNTGQDSIPLSGASVVIGSNTYTTDTDGFISADIAEGAYNLYIRKQGYIIHTSELAVNTNLSLSYTLRQESYQVEFIVKDAAGELPLDSCRISVDGEIKFTGTDGSALFENLPSEFTIDFFKQHYELVSDSEFVISGDTTIILYAEKAKYLVGFTVKDIYSGIGIRDVTIKFGEDSIKTNVQGKVYKELFFGNYDLIISNFLYASLKESIEVSSDTTFTFYLSPIFAYIKFKVMSGVSSLYKARVSIGNDTLYTNSVGIATFNDMNTNSEYSYKVVKEGYKTVGDVLYLRKDTIVTIQMEEDATHSVDDKNYEMKLWPNPANTELHISGLPSQKEFSGSVINIQGIEVLNFKCSSSSENILNIKNLPDGVYFIRLVSGDSDYQRLFIKRGD